MYFTKPISTILLILVIGTGWLMFSTTPFLAKSNHPTQRIIFTNDSNITDGSTNHLSESLNVKRSESSIDVSNQLPLSSSYRVTQIPGDWRLFSVLNVTDGTYYEINATLEIVGINSLIYSTYTSGYNSIYQGIDNSFESTIYPTLTEFFGSPPDIDSNAKTIILLFDIIDNFGGGQFVAGFFDPLHQTTSSGSEHAEILHIDGTDGFSNLNSGDFEVIAHEFQHLIHYKHDTNEDVWLEEGASMFAEYLIGRDPFSTGSYKSRFTSNPDVSLTYWDYYDSQSLVLANYGAAYAFFLYLAEKYGGSSIIQNIVSRSVNGTSSVEQALVNQGYLGEFEEVFRNWTVANFVNDTSFANGAYGYYNTSFVMDLDLPPYTTSPVPRTINSVPYWGTDYLKFDYPSEIPFSLEFGGIDSSGFLVTAILTNTTPSLNIEVIPIPISATGFGNFSTETLGISADNIVIAVSAYTKAGTSDHDNEYSAPSQSYWYMVNPQGLIVTPGNLTIISNGGLLLDIWNITVIDNTDYIWQEAEGAIYDILTDSGESSGVTGNLTFSTENQYWEATSIDISELLDGNYRIKFYFFNSSSSGFAYSEIFSVSQESTDSSTTTTSKSSPISGFLVIFSILTLTILFSKRKKK